MKKLLNNNTIYYTIINKKDLEFEIPKNSNKRLETLQSNYILMMMLDFFGINHDNIYISKKGKPYFKNKNMCFNYSHSKNFIACCLSKYNVGIDIEETNRIINDVMIKICKLSHDNPLEDFVKREAFSKLTGEGIAMFFNKNNSKNIEKSNTIITTENYVCSICCDYNNPIFEFINIQ